jgi:nucleotide-binding universal stress UspA family protein
MALTHGQRHTRSEPLHGSDGRSEHHGSPGRPVLLATLDVPFDHDAVVFAVDTAVELGERLVIANVVERPPLPLSTMFGYEDLPYAPEMADSLAEPVRLARSLGVDVTRLRVKSLHPIAAMLEAVAEQSPCVFVFGPDRRRMMRLRYWRAARAVRSRVTTLVWMAD